MSTPPPRGSQDCVGQPARHCIDSLFIAGSPRTIRAHRHLERQFGPAADRHLLRLPRGGPARRPVPAGDQVPGRGVPAPEIERLGYNVAVHGQKTFNGVAILSKRPLEVARGLPGDETTLMPAISRRSSPAGGGVCGSPRSTCRTATRRTDKYAYKLAWMERLDGPRPRRCSRLEEPLVLAGDFNVIPDAARRRRSGRLGAGRPLICRRPARAFRDAEPRPDRRLARGRPTPPVSTPSGTIRPAPGRGTTASASTTCCSRRRPPTGSLRSRSTSTCARRDRPSDHVPVRIDLA